VLWTLLALVTRWLPNCGNFTDMYSVAAALHSCMCSFHTDVAEVAFNRCVTTNEGKKDRRRNEVHATSDTFVVDYNYEFLEDFQGKDFPDR